MDTVTLKGPGALIAAIPELIGYRPHEEIIIAAVLPDRTVGALGSVEREWCLMDGAADRVGRDFAQSMRTSRADMVIMVTFTEEDTQWGCEAADALRPALEAAVTRVEHWICTDGRYFSPDCADVNCCPPDGIPVPSPPRLDRRVEIDPAPSMTPLVLPGLHRASSVDRQRARAAGQRWWARRDRDPDVAGWRRRAWDRCERSRDVGAGPLEWGKALAGLRDVVVRDAVIVQWLGAGASAIAAVLDGGGREDVAMVMDRALSTSSSTVPDPALVAASLQWCAQLASVAPRRDLAAVWSLMAVLTWWRADVDGAQYLADRARELDPHYSLADLVLKMCVRGIGPGWSRVE